MNLKFALIFEVSELFEFSDFEVQIISLRLHLDLEGQLDVEAAYLCIFDLKLAGIGQLDLEGIN